MNSLLGTAVPSSFSLLIGGLRHDGLASIVVFLVALPLCIGVTIASGAPTGSGIVTGIVAGLDPESVGNLRRRGVEAIELHRLDAS